MAAGRTLRRCSGHAANRERIYHRPSRHRYHSRSFADHWQAGRAGLGGREEGAPAQASETAHGAPGGAPRARRNRLWTLTGSAVVAVAVVVVASVALTGGFSSATAGSGHHRSSPRATPSATPSAISEPAHHCTYTPNPPAARKVSFPPATPDYKASYRATIRTNRGNIGIRLLNSKATCTVNSF